jgi:2-polyprenyl-3-methyl-5-hydroxy-6-metoxy-1,4-benzoquinol methylase
MKYDNKPKEYYAGARYEVLENIDLRNVKTFLDIGCGNGATLKVTKENNPEIELWGVEYMPEQAEKVKSITKNILVGAIEDNIKNLPDNYFDVITMLDVIEHLTYPEEVLKSLKSKLTKDGVLVSSIPNVRFVKNLYKLLVLKDWKYEESGILDYTHMRFFTSKSIIRMYKKLDFEILKHQGVIPLRRDFKKWLLFNIASVFIWNDTKYLQFFTIVKNN